MGKRTRQRLDDLTTKVDGILAFITLHASAPEPAGITTYHATNDPDVWLKRTQTEATSAEAMDWYARMHRTDAPVDEHYNAKPVWHTYSIPHAPARMDTTCVARDWDGREVPCDDGQDMPTTMCAPDPRAQLEQIERELLDEAPELKRARALADFARQELSRAYAPEHLCDDPDNTLYDKASYD